MNNIFYAKPANITERRLVLEGAEAHHACQVLRYREGDKLTAVDGGGGFYQGLITSAGGEHVTVEIEKAWRAEEIKPKISLGMGLVKKRDRLEFAVEKAVELGAGAIYLFPGYHSERQKARVDRLQTIGLGAMKQSLRAYRPEIRKFSGLQQLLARNDAAYPVAAHQGAQSLQQQFDTLNQKSELLLLVGPEGGFHPEEIELIKEFGGSIVSLGSKRLRTETAALVFLTPFFQ